MERGFGIMRPAAAEPMETEPLVAANCNRL
jgi:hypothetical protein